MTGRNLAVEKGASGDAALEFGANPPPGRAPGPAIVTVCIWCRAEGAPRESTPGEALLASALAAAAGFADVLVRPTQCLSVCKRVCSASISGEGAYTYLFGDLDPASDGEALVAMARACVAAPHGFVPWKARPEALRKGIIARVPPPGWSPEDGSAPA
jgi:predicted metal-binding protein